MSDKMTADGVIASFNRDRFIVTYRFTEADSERTATCTLSGKMRKYSIRVLEGDKVTIEIDMSITHATQEKFWKDLISVLEKHDKNFFMEIHNHFNVKGKK